MRLTDYFLFVLYICLHVHAEDPRLRLWLCLCLWLCRHIHSWDYLHKQQETSKEKIIDAQCEWDLKLKIIFWQRRDFAEICLEQNS